MLHSLILRCANGLFHLLTGAIRSHHVGERSPFAGLVYRVQLLLLLMMLLLTTLKASNVQPSSWYFVQLVIKVFEKKNMDVLGLKAACLDSILFLWWVNFSSAVGHVSPCTSSDFVQLVQQQYFW